MDFVHVSYHIILYTLPNGFYIAKDTIKNKNIKSKLGEISSVTILADITSKRYENVSLRS